MNIKVGSKVRVKTKKQTYEGILMPRIELGDTSSVVIKLSNGYNTGIRFEKGVKIEKIKKNEEQIKGSEKQIKGSEEQIRNIILEVLNKHSQDEKFYGLVGRFLDEDIKKEIGSKKDYKEINHIILTYVYDSLEDHKYRNLEEEKKKLTIVRN